MDTRNKTPKQLKRAADSISDTVSKMAQHQMKAVAEGNMKDAAYCTEQMAIHNADLAVVLRACSVTEAAMEMKMLMGTQNKTPKQLRETADRISVMVSEMARRQIKAVANGNMKDAADCTERMAIHNADLAVVLEALDECDKGRR